MKMISDSAMDILQDFMTTRINENLNNLVLNTDLQEFMEDYTQFCLQVESGSLGKMARLFKSYSDNVCHILQLIHTVKTNDYSLYCQCLYFMADIFFAIIMHVI